MPSNIAEGSSRTEKSFSHFLDISLGSSFELGTQLLVAKHRNYINQQELENLDEKIQEFQKMTMGFQNGLLTHKNLFSILFFLLSISIND